MRMWMVNPKFLCRKHLLGEHVECHMFAGTIIKGRCVNGYLKKGLLEMHNLNKRHDILAEEMQSRGYVHKSPLIQIDKEGGCVDVVANKEELSKRCVECSIRIKEI
jgi:hypothetical protein